MTTWLQSMGAEVVGYSLPAPTTPSLFELAGLGDRMRSIEGDVRDLGSLTAAMAASRPEIVIHMAAQALVRRSYRDPVETFATNVMGTVNFLEAARSVGTARAALVVTSDKCYENREWVWGYRESEAMGGHDPYSSSKGCAELVTSAYRRSFFSGGEGSGAAAVASARAGNVIGGGDWAEDRLVPDMIRAFTRGEAVEIRNPAAIRPWQHVLEPLRGYLLLVEHLWAGGEAAAEGWNFGASAAETRPVSWIVGQLAELWGGGAEWTAAAGAQPHEANHLALDCAKARTLLGWTPALPLRTALEWIVEWHREHLAGADVRAVTERQILAYQQLLIDER